MPTKLKSLWEILSTTKLKGRNLATISKQLPANPVTPCVPLNICYRVAAQGSEASQALPSFHDIISRDEDAVLRPIVLITNSISGIVDKVQTLLMYWEKKYKHVWEQDKEAYIRFVHHPPVPVLNEAASWVCSGRACADAMTHAHRLPLPSYGCDEVLKASTEFHHCLFELAFHNMKKLVHDEVQGPYCPLTTPVCVYVHRWIL